MAQQKSKKHKPRNRTDPARREIAAQRDEARRLAADERRQAQKAAERRTALRKRIRKLVIPALIGIAVFVCAVLFFKPQREIKGVEKIEMAALFERLGYQIPGQTDQASLPNPECGALAEPIATSAQLYSDLDNGVVVLWYKAGDTATATALPLPCSCELQRLTHRPGGGNRLAQMDALRNGRRDPPQLRRHVPESGSGQGSLSDARTVKKARIGV
jgi:hypothetical protein